MPERPFMERYGLALAKTLVHAANDVVYARVFNPGTSDVTVYKHAHIALFTPVCRIGFEQYLKILQLYHENSRFPPSFKFEA
jgi:hypothetical protein